MRRTIALLVIVMACNDEAVVGNFELPLPVRIHVDSVTPSDQQFVVHFRVINDADRAVLIRRCGDHVQVAVNRMIGADFHNIEGGFCPAVLQVHATELVPGGEIPDAHIVALTGWYNFRGWVDNDGRGKSRDLYSPPFEVR